MIRRCSTGCPHDLGHAGACMDTPPLEARLREHVDDGGLQPCCADLLRRAADALDALEDRVAKLNLALLRVCIRLERGVDEPAIADDPGGAAKSITEAVTAARAALAVDESEKKP